MLPLWFLAAMLGITLCALAAHVLLRRRIARRLQALASEWQMHYSKVDRFKITPRVIEHFPVPGAADLRVMDLIYLPERDSFRYLFTVEYTAGVVRTKHRVRRVATFCEARDRACADGFSPLVLAPEGLPLVEQYRRLWPSNSLGPHRQGVARLDDR